MTKLIGKKITAKAKKGLSKTEVDIDINYFLKIAGYIDDVMFTLITSGV
ncbi:hypothetical protein J8M14_09380 [Aquimarina sp. MMG016]|nr:hypothetical protein [Aquimarina sp. MMG016]